MSSKKLLLRHLQNLKDILDINDHLKSFGKKIFNKNKLADMLAQFTANVPMDTEQIKITIDSTIKS